MEGLKPTAASPALRGQDAYWMGFKAKPKRERTSGNLWKENEEDKRERRDFYTEAWWALNKLES